MVYQKKNEQLSDKELETLKLVFQDFPSAISELTVEEDVVMLRTLEKEKQIDVTNLVSENLKKYRYKGKKTEDDSFWLYYLPRHEVLENIRILKCYDQADALAEKRENEARYTNEQNKKKEVLNKIYVMGQNLINMSIKESGIGEIKINLDAFHNYQNIGYIYPELLEWTDKGMLILGGNGLNLQIPIYSYELYPDSNEMELVSHAMQLTFSIDNSFNENIEMLKIYKDKKLNEIHQDY